MSINKSTVFRKSEKDWTQDKVERLWNWYGSNPYMQYNYFTYTFGNGIANFLKETGKLQGRVLDYGCGPGYLIEHLLKFDLKCYGADVSKESIRHLKDKFGHNPNWKQSVIIKNSRTSYPDCFFDVITLVETLEHLSNELIFYTFSELKRLIRPEGIILITTPFEENLDKNLLYCPFCNSEFHKWQHLSSFSVNSLTDLLTENKFCVDFCQSMDFDQFQRSFELPTYLDISLYGLYLWMCHKKRKLLDQFFPRTFPNSRDFQYRLRAGLPQPHLCAIATIKDN